MRKRRIFFLAFFLSKISKKPVLPLFVFLMTTALIKMIAVMARKKNVGRD